ncbi:MAG: ribonuclease H-like domain-containing protein [Flavobacteriales bacterium]|nr:ribonuclease H-like domain-containing protein [Flavobacteriales bacterium]MCX7649107.1 ribonuclease H-like domain-containing protein [Flavobacteriales bacterium]MDW8432025.1 ribonuclease H-like domain-containing protein [Flavobacteriales bacterium]
MKPTLPSSILFLDIETVPLWPSLEEAPERFRKLWQRKAEILARHQPGTPEILYERAGIYAEFGRIICISVGYFAEGSARIKSFVSEDEKNLLMEFSELMRHPKFEKLCGHNAKEFDFPYICRRLLAQDLPLPELLNLSGKKPWEVQLLDTMEMWKFGDFKSFVSLDLLSAVLGLASPKSDMDGSQVYSVFYHEKDLEKIRLYCEQDVRTLMGVFARLNGYSLEGIFLPE